MHVGLHGESASGPREPVNLGIMYTTVGTYSTYNTYVGSYWACYDARLM